MPIYLMFYQIAWSISKHNGKSVRISMTKDKFLSYKINCLFIRRSWTIYHDEDGDNVKTYVSITKP